MTLTFVHSRSGRRCCCSWLPQNLAGTVSTLHRSWPAIARSLAPKLSRLRNSFSNLDPLSEPIRTCTTSCDELRYKSAYPSAWLREHFPVIQQHRPRGRAGQPDGAQLQLRGSSLALFSTAKGAGSPKSCNFSWTPTAVHKGVLWHWLLLSQPEQNNSSNRNFFYNPVIG